MPKKKVVAKAEKPEIILTYSEDRSGGEAIDPDDRWTDHEPEYIDWTARDVYIDEPGKRAREKTDCWYVECLSPNFEVKKGDTIWLLVVRYTTGSTFGTTNGVWHIEGVFQHQGQATKIEKMILEDWHEHSRMSSYQRKRSGEKVKEKYVSPHGYKVWMGHFESLESVQVESFIVK